MIVIVFGLPGSGKSYFASRLAPLVHANYINSDLIRKKMHAMRTYSDREKLSVYDAMLAEMRRSIEQNSNLVLDATFYKQEIRKKFIDEATPAGGIVFIEVKAEEPVIKERLKQKRPDSEADFEVYKIIEAQWEPFPKPHLTLASGDNNIEEMLLKAREYLQKKK